MEDIERKTLAQLIRDEKYLKVCNETKLTEKYFQFRESRQLYRILKWHYEVYHQPLQSDSLQSAFGLSKSLTEDDKAKIGLLFEEVKAIPESSNFSLILAEFLNYYKIHKVKALLNSAIDPLQDKNPELSLSEIKTRLLEMDREFTSDRTNSGYFENNSQSILETYHDKKLNPDKYIGVGMGFPDLDRDVTLHPGNVALVLGEMKSAKSVLMVNIANNLLLKGKRVYYHANEGGKDLIENRLISCATGLPITPIERTLLTPEQEVIFTDYLNQSSTHQNLYIDSVPPSLSRASYIESKIMELQADGKIDVAIIDYLGLMQADNKNVKAGWEIPGAITLELKSVAMKTGVPIILVAHVNRKGMDDDKDHYALSEMGLSIEPLKHVDLIASWRIHNIDSFKKTNIGDGTLSIQGSRNSKQPKVILSINTNIMKIKQYQKLIVEH